MSDIEEQKPLNPLETQASDASKSSDGSNQIAPEAIEKMSPDVGLSLETPKTETPEAAPAPTPQQNIIQKIVSGLAGGDKNATGAQATVNKTKQIAMLTGLVLVCAAVGGYFYMTAMEDQSWTPPAKPRMAVRRPPPVRKPVPPRAVMQQKQAVLPVGVITGKPMAPATQPNMINPAMPNAQQLKTATPLVANSAHLAEQMKMAKIQPLAAQPKLNEAPKKSAGAPIALAGGKPVVKEMAGDMAVSSVEQAIVDNSAVLDAIPTPVEEVKSVAAKKPVSVVSQKSQTVKGGKKVTEILAKKANIRPLPNKYVVVQKEKNEDDFDARLTGARSALAQNRYVASLELFSDLFEAYPQDVRVLMGRAVSLQKLSRNTEALNTYEEVLNVDPKNIEALTNMLGILGAQEKEIALKHLLQLKDMHPYNADIMAQLGMIYGVTGDYKNAVKYLDMADVLNPDNVNIMFNKAVALDKMGKKDDAVDLYRKLVYMASYGDNSSTIPVEQIKKRLGGIR